MKINKNNFFWISYTDLMTSLFFIMLILFVMASSGLYRQKKCYGDGTEEHSRYADSCVAA